ncbi:SPOR domain-containing protein [Natronoflexus pectinivorans]|uniref:SPOR domain-containing protein n=1 Tax=Natronoflexus pectinivorans TaxID=682526 RepID=A0A4R2GN53_9BACT|nr:SPOR domain-containing protein [Natronoflexus pectinivorans]TCO10705.1 hypothetical protein EV194_101336 [Natronoflexus pectinivorans]
MEDKETNPIESGGNTRASALEKEIIRLKSNSKRQSAKYQRLKKWTIFQLFFFFLFFLMLLLFNVIQWPAGSDSIRQETIVIRDTIRVTEFRDEESIPPIESLIKIPIPENGILFSVQIGAFTSINLSEFTLNLVSLNQYSFEAINQYTVGLFEDFNNAEKFRQEIVRMGFNDAFIIATKNGRRIDLQEALVLQRD